MKRTESIATKSMGAKLVSHYRLSDLLQWALWLTCAAFALTTIESLVTAVFMFWDPSWAASALSLLKGYQVYYGPSQGPALAWYYGPIAQIIYLPAALGRDPIQVCALGSTIGMLSILFPLIAILRHTTRESSTPWLTALAAFFLLPLVFTISPTLTMTWTRLHPDSPALGFGALACFWASQPKKRDQFWQSLWCGVFVGLSLWSKQTLAPLALAIPLYVLFADGGSRALRFGFGYALGAGAVSLAVIAYFGFGPLYFEMVQYPLAFSWHTCLNCPGPEDFVNIKDVTASLFIGIWFRGFSDYLTQALPFLIPLASIALYTFFTDRPEKANLRSWLEKNPQWLYFWVGLCLIPTCVLGRVKYGGGPHNHAASIFFLTLSLSVLLGKYLSDERRSVWKLKRAAQAWTTVLLLVCSFALIRAANSRWWTIRELSHSPLQTAFHYAERHPGEMYFPWYPLASFLAEGKLYHWVLGMNDKSAGRYPVTGRQLASYLPDKLRAIAFYDQDPASALKYFPEFTRRVEDPELPGWKIFEREDR